MRESRLLEGFFSTQVARLGTSAQSTGGMAMTQVRGPLFLQSLVYFLEPGQSCGLVLVWAAGARDAGAVICGAGALFLYI
jgi:hypothetical protein